MTKDVDGMVPQVGYYFRWLAVNGHEIERIKRWQEDGDLTVTELHVTLHRLLESSWDEAWELAREEEA